MVKITKKISMLLLIMAFSASLVACGTKEEAEEKETTEITTTKKEKPTKKVEETTTEYQFKGEKFLVASEKNSQKMMDLTVSPGDTIWLNELFVDKMDDEEICRGNFLNDLYLSLGMDANIVKQKFQDEKEVLYVEEKENYNFVYEGDKAVTFHFVDKVNDFWRFDVY